MTVSAMQKMLGGLPPDMDVLIATDNELISVCGSSGVDTVFDENCENPVSVFMIFGCQPEEQQNTTQDFEIDHEKINFN